MSKELEEKIIGLIDDYMERGLCIVIHPGTSDEQFWLSLADNENAPYIKAMNNIADRISESLYSIAEDICHRDIDFQNDAPLHKDDGERAYEHPLSAIAEALFEIARKKKEE